MIYLLNTPVLTTYGLWRFDGPLTPKTARAKLEGQEIISAIGHTATAELLGELLQRPVPVNRIAAKLQPGDSALVFRLTQRLPEGRVLMLSVEELAAMPYEFGWLHYYGAEMIGTAT